MHSTLYQLYSRTLRKYLKFSSRLEKGISNGTFFKKSEYDQNTLVRRVERLKQKLEHLKLQLKFAAAGLATTLIMTTADVNAQSPGLGPFIQQGRLDNPLRPPIQIRDSNSDMFDIDGDGDLDLFVGEDDGSVHFFRNYRVENSLSFDAFDEPSPNPYSYFQAYGSYLNSTIAFADIDGDGDTDAVVGFTASSVPHIFFEYDDIGGVFLAPQRYGTPLGFILNGYSRPHFNFGNFDGDADLEAFVGTEDGDIAFIEWNGSNWIRDNAATNLDQIASSIVVAGGRGPALYDIDGDTFLDAFIGLDDGTIKLYKGTSTPLQFVITEEVAGNPFNGVDVGNMAYPRFIDFDGDTDIEMIVSNQNFSIGSQDYATIRVFENDGADNFQLTKGLENPFGGVDVGNYSDPTWADIDNDGDADIFIGSYDQGVVFFQNLKDIYGYDRFQIQTGVNNPLDMVSGLFDTSPQFGKLDIDADLDLFVGTNNTLLYFKNIGSVSSPNFVQNAAYPGNTLITNLPGFIYEYIFPSLGDIDSDGDLDAYVSSRGYSAGRSFSMINNGTPVIPNFDTPVVDYSFDSKDNQLVDLDHDGDADLVIGTASGGSLTMRQNQESYGFRNLIGSANPFNGLSMEDSSTPSFIDIDLDGDLDLFVGNKYGVIEFFRNENQPPVLTINATPQDFTENGASIQLDAGASITDPDANEYIIQGTISITNFVSGEDELTFADDPDITEFWDPGSGVLSLSDTATAGAYAALIQSINYQNLSENPNTTPRTISLELRDTDFTNPAAVIETVNIIPVNDPPGITSIPGTTATEDVTFTYTPTVNDPDDVNNGTDLTWSLTNAPAGMTVNTLGIVSWTPGEVLTSNSVTLTVQDGGEDGASPDSQVFTITVTPVNDAPAITSTAPATATEGVQYTYTPTVLDPDDTNNGTNLAWSLSNPPTGMALSTTGVVTWTPVDGVLTSGPVTLTVQDGGENGALPASEVFTITVTPVNSAPVLNLNTATSAYTENATPLVLTPLATVSDADAVNLSFEIIATITNYQSGEDVLEATPSGSVTGTFDNVTGVLTISGTGTVSQFQNVLRSLTYENTSEEPNTTTRNISIIADDGVGLSTTQIINIAVISVNDAPTISGTASALDHTMGISTIDNTVTVSDVDNTSLVSAQVAITSGFTSGTDLLDFTPQGSITGSYNSSSGILSLNGTGTATEYASVLQSVTYQNTLEFDVSTRTIQFSVNDGTVDSNGFLKTINVDISDLPPSLALTSSSFSYTENAGALSIDPGITITDDSPEITGGMITIATNFTSGEDILEFTDQSGITGVFDPLTGVLTLSGNASAAEYEAAIASLTFENTSDDPGAVTKTVEIQLEDGTNTSPAVSLDVQITPVNDAPQLAGSGTDLSYRSLTGSVVIDDQITVTDPDDVDISGAVVTVAANYSSGEDILGFTDQNGINGSFNAVTGVLTLSGSATKADYQTALRSITYENTVNAPSAATKSISFQVSDLTTSSTDFTRNILVASNQVVAASIDTQVDLGSSITIDVIDQATFTAGDQITTTITGPPTAGTAVVNSDGSILYTPNNNNADGDIDQITYELCNEFISCGSNAINVTINNSAPVINIAATLIQPGGSATVSLLSGISDQNGNIDPSSVRIIDGPSSGLPASIDSDLNLIIDYSGSGFTGADHILIEACDFSGACTQFDVVIVVGDVNEVTVYQGVTPNNDGINDVLRILDVEFFPNNEIFIYNKIGKLVYNVSGYDNFGVVFAGFDDQGNELPDGTYYYVIILEPGNRQSGFVVLQR